MPALVFLRRTVGGRGVYVAQTCTDAQLVYKTAHIGTTRPTPRSKRLRRCAFPTCAIVQPLVLRLQAALGSGGYPCKRADVHPRYACALSARGGEGLGPAGAVSQR